MKNVLPKCFTPERKSDNKAAVSINLEMFHLSSDTLENRACENTNLGACVVLTVIFSVDWVMWTSRDYCKVIQVVRIRVQFL